MHRVVHGRRTHQRGAVIITVCLMLLFLLGFMGFALDLGRLFIVKSELQTAMDSCALAAAQELDGTGTAITRARSAGATAGNLNRVNLQSASWDGKGQIDPNVTISFRDAGYIATTDPVQAKYAICEHTQDDVRLWLLQAFGAFTGDAATFSNTHDVAAMAVATRGHSQTSCPLPVAMQPKTSSSGPPNYGYTPGEWVTLLMSQSATPNGYIGWANLDGSSNAAETEAELRGKCGVRTGDELGTPGVQASIADIWNSRFGILRNNSDPAADRPDFTGYAYTAHNWPSQFNAYNGPVPPGAHATAQNFLAKRAAFANCADTGTRVNVCESIINRSLNSFNRLLASGPNAANGHRAYGTNKRIVVVPITTSYPGSVEDYACMLLLQPLSVPMGDVQLEFIGNASDPASPCVTSGLPGGTAGPLVPVLVR